jgi:plastocyanin
MFHRTLAVFVCLSIGAVAQSASLQVQGTLQNPDSTAGKTSRLATIYVCKGATTSQSQPCGGGIVLATETAVVNADANGTFNHMLGESAWIKGVKPLSLQDPGSLTAEVWSDGVRQNSTSMVSQVGGRSQSRGGSGSNDSGGTTIRLRDDCDPATFNAARGAGTCVGEGGTTFDAFIAEVTQNKFADEWKYQPNAITVRPGTTLTLWNRGGETHTFTQVAEFGGGFRAQLNQLSGNPVPRPECAQVVNGNLVPQPASPQNIFVKAGNTLTGPQVPTGITKFQCCFHPWMRIMVTTGTTSSSSLATPSLVNKSESQK